MAIKTDKSPPQEAKPEELLDIGIDESGDFSVINPTIEIPPFPGKSLKADKSHIFWKWVDNLKPEHWNMLSFYCYRIWPYIDRQRTNPSNPKYVDVYSNPFSEDTIKKGDDGTDHRGHGSGRYFIIINDSTKSSRNKNGKRVGQIGEAHFEISDPNYPPVFRMDEYVPEHPSNRSLTDSLVAEGKITPEGKLMTQQQGGDNIALVNLLSRIVEKLQQPQTSSKDTTSETISKMFLEANQMAMAMMKDQIKADDPEKLVKLLTGLKEMLPKTDSNNGTLELIVKMQGDMARIQAESSAAREAMMMKFMEMTTAKKEDDGEDKFLARFMAYKEIFEGMGGREGKKSTLETVMEYGAPVAERLLSVVGGFVQLAVTNKANGTKTTVNPEQVRQQIEQPNKPPQTAPQEQPIEAQVEQPKDNVVEMPQQPTLRTLIAGPVGPMIIDALKGGKTGSDFADSVCIMFNDMTYQQIASLGKETILNEMKAVPSFYSQVVPSAIEKFVDDFIAYGSEEEGEDIENE